MPQLKKISLNADTTLAIWQVTEEPEQLLNAYSWLEPVFSKYNGKVARQRLLEKLTEALLIDAITGDKHACILHDVSRHPILIGYFIGISHTKGFTAVILSKQRNVSIDIEYQSERVSRIANRFIRPDEQNDNVTRQLINWCSKEVCYKYYYPFNLQYFDMKLLPFELSEKGVTTVELMHYPLQLDVHYNVYPDYTLAYCY